jgi:hypothetical protein
MFGGASRDRTDDLIVANDALSQLSYSPLYGLGGGARLFYQRSGIGTNGSLPNLSVTNGSPSCGNLKKYP